MDRLWEEGEDRLHVVNGGIFTPAVWGTYVSTKHVLESIAEAMQQEMAPFGIKVQTVNPSAYLTGYNETMPDDVL
jgi:NAD(P)-dependent dehydrogenase (short-subunit alcohol dehydrogenase family)